MCYRAALVGCQVIIAAAFLLRVGKSLAVGWLLMLRTKSMADIENEARA